MARVLVMIPSGEVYNHDCVRWYGYPNTQRDINSYHNIGDAFVYDSSLKLLEFEKLGVLEIADPDMKEIDRLREEYDYVFLRGSNYIHETMNWRQTAAALRRLKLPVIAFGVGAQAPVKGRLQLSEESEDRTATHLQIDRIVWCPRVVLGAGPLGHRRQERAHHRMPDGFPQQRPGAGDQAAAVGRRAPRWRDDPP